MNRALLSKPIHPESAYREDWEAMLNEPRHMIHEPDVSQKPMSGWSFTVFCGVALGMCLAAGAIVYLAAPNGGW